MAEKNEETPMEDRPEAGPPDQGAGPDAPPSNLNEEVEQAAETTEPEAEATEAPEAAAEETPEAAAEEAPAEEAPAAEEAAAKPKATAKSGPTRREKLEAKRA